jgi:hypothetical protein
MLLVLRIVGPHGTLGHADIVTGIQVPDRFEWVDSVSSAPHLQSRLPYYNANVCTCIYIRISIGASACAGASMSLYSA